MQKSDPLVSIVTICYNLENEIGRTLESVLRLDSKDFEYIIIDGESNDNTLSIIKDYEPKFLAKDISFSYYSEKDKGIYDAMNKGVLKAKGQWINILTGGDEFHQELSLQDMFRNPKPNCIYFGKSISYYKDFKKIRYKDFHLGKKEWYFDYMPNHQAVFVPSEFCKKNPYSLKLSFYSDTKFLRKAFEELEYEFKDVFVSKFEIGGVSNYYGSFKNYKKTFQDVLLLEKNILKRMKRIAIHTFKYGLQVLMGKERYLHYYTTKFLKEK